MFPAVSASDRTVPGTLSMSPYVAMRTPSSARTTPSSTSGTSVTQTGQPGPMIIFAVVRRAADDGVARAALRAVREGVAIAAVGRIEDVGETVVARGQVGRDGGARRGDVVARSDLESFGRLGLDRPPLDLAYARRGRRLPRQPLDEALQVIAERI